jgi:ankyrin repeat protein
LTYSYFGSINEDAIDLNNRTPLHYAVRQHHTECIQILIDRGANLFTVDQNLRSILHHAVSTVGVDNSELISSLIEKGLEVDAQDKLCNTSLHCAALCRNVNACRMLLERGANIQHIVSIACDSKLKFV